MKHKKLPEPPMPQGPEEFEPVIDEYPMLDSLVKDINEKIKQEPALLVPEILKDRMATVKDKFTPLQEYVANVRKNMFSYVRPKGFWGRLTFDHQFIKLDKALDSAQKTLSGEKVLDDKRRAASVIKDVDNILKAKGFMDMKGWGNTFKLAMNPTKSMLINMELRTGKFTNFIAKMDFPYFDFMSGRYIIDDNFKYYNQAAELWCLDYHQDCCLPLRRKFDLNAIYEAVKNDETIETETSINPVSFKIFMESDIIQKVMKGAEMEQWLSFIKMCMIITMIGIVILIVMVGRVMWMIGKATGK